ncbi:hypothetical protein PIB30_048051 [Stylosanthes scabra]|uniref:Retrotransposon Copia-like N-terminal domain-containing protein n=1 Tax=Stylosanthes scabra TaxID=79078 RepID=A0ABU6RH82_9FABA|nr:hypothetical protein [Stylosanthes scabra]
MASLSVGSTSSHSSSPAQPLQLAPLPDAYALQTGDHPGLVLVSQPLKEDNYASWCGAMRLSHRCGAASVIYAGSTAIHWQDLEAHFSQSNPPQLGITSSSTPNLGVGNAMGRFNASPGIFNAIA